MITLDSGLLFWATLYYYYYYYYEKYIMK